MFYLLLYIYCLCLIVNLFIIKDINKEIREAEKELQKQRQIIQCYYLYAKSLDEAMNKQYCIIRQRNV